MSPARIEDLKRRIQRDPASIAFAQLGEEYRRAGQFHEAIDTCKSGLAIHPGYLSARLTLARAYRAIGDTASAERELQLVLQLAPDNLVALRELSDLSHNPAGSSTSAAVDRLQRWLDGIVADRKVGSRQ